MARTKVTVDWPLVISALLLSLYGIAIVYSAGQTDIPTYVARAWRNGVLLAASVVFYAWGEAKYLALALGSVAFNWWMGLHIARANNPATRKRRLALAVTGNLGALAIFNAGT